MVPLLCLHGGPGACHDYLESLDAIADSGRQVIYYDQLGCGNSSIPVSNPAMWTIPLYVEEVDVVRQALGLERIHLLGQSWGGMLAMEYMFTQPAASRHRQSDYRQFTCQHDSMGGRSQPPA